MIEPLSPDIVNQPNAQEIKKLIEYFNLYLSKSWSKYEKKNGRCMSIPGLTEQAVLEHVIDLYKGKGWTVEIEHSRNEAYVRFKPVINGRAASTS